MTDNELMTSEVGLVFVAIILLIILCVLVAIKFSRNKHDR